MGWRTYRVLPLRNKSCMYMYNNSMKNYNSNHNHNHNHNNRIYGKYSLIYAKQWEGKVGGGIYASRYFNSLYKTSSMHIISIQSSWLNLLDLYSLSERAFYCKTSWRLEAARFGFRLFQSLWN